MDIVGKEIITNTGKAISFRNNIKKTILYEGFIVVLLEKETDSEFNENVYCVDLEEESIIWQIPKYQYSYSSSSFVDIYKVNDQVVRLFNWDGSKAEVEIASGKVLLNPEESRKGKRPF